MRIAIVACAVLVGGCVSANGQLDVWFDIASPPGKTRGKEAFDMDAAGCRFAAQSAMQGRAPFVPYSGTNVNAATANLIGAMSVPEAPSVSDCLLAKGWRYLGKAPDRAEADRMIDRYKASAGR
ncbi:hypothetical protein GGR16_002636 [Chelatococcus caeni]|uniref:Lipoprotein n=1 Tax=Chelatococcus caeni TaxID=1348468 RepID=A0A840C0U0_9HYPH|nr:hypothetical protein [Chelatococcus caeni]